MGMQGRIENPQLLWLQLYVTGTGELDSGAGARFIADLVRRMDVHAASADLRSDPWQRMFLERHHLPP